MNKKIEKEKRKSAFLYFAVVLFSLAFIIVGFNLNKSSNDVVKEEFVQAKVTQILNVKEEKLQLDPKSEPVVNKEITAKATFTSGPLKGKTKKILQYIDNTYAVNNRPVKVNDKVLLTYGQVPNGSSQAWIFINFDRIEQIIKLCAFFFLLIVAISLKKGISTVISLAFTAGVIFLVFIPAILSGRNIYLLTIIVSIYIVVMSLALMNGINKKTLCAILGNVGGIAIAGIISIVISKTLGVTGFVDEDYIFLMYVRPDNPLDLRAIIWAGIMIGSLGAIMDVAMSIASAMKELADTMQRRTIRKLIKSGMNIGRDAIGTMTNTLILAYIGGSLATVLLLVSTNKNLLFLFNMEMIIVEILQSIVGSIGIIFAVPVTVIICAYIYHKKEGRHKDEEDL